MYASEENASNTLYRSKWITNDPYNPAISQVRFTVWEYRYEIYWSIMNNNRNRIRTKGAFGLDLISSIISVLDGGMGDPIPSDQRKWTTVAQRLITKSGVSLLDIRGWEFGKPTLIGVCLPIKNLDAGFQSALDTSLHVLRANLFSSPSCKNQMKYTLLQEIPY